ncbi:protocadherin gamma-A11-like isoform X16 [Chiloscyllium plagiosum]|uniref:protocadherin gamma-A11-like isoform X16 n=1 Tax=Chiloscyllium plagiosum TaxID=36176 RepID=UPI001CB810F2|nr:protocadherin gamma-A11-like isoform X16 [Chiloscyllium plagiosum]
MGFYNINWLLRWQLQLLCLVFSWNLVSGQIRYSIPEELQLGAFVGDIAADLGLNVKQLSTRNFRIVSGPRIQYFGVNVDNGILVVQENIDREQLCGSSLGCTLTLEAVIEEPLNVYHVEVEILDINDNAPHFPKGQLRLEISELAVPGIRFPLEPAYDPDVGTNSLQSYQLAPNQYFNLDVQTRSEDAKLPVLVMEQPLDREQQPTLQLVLTATDGGTPQRSGTAQILIHALDANDNVPAFSQSLYRASLMENVPIGTLVIKVNATDPDEGSNGEIVYSFGSHASAKVRELFNVDHTTGEIRVKGHLDFESAKQLEISVQAVDKGALSVPVHCDVIVQVNDVNDNAPEVTVTSLSSSVPEDAIPGTVLALISVTDSDMGENGNTHCQIPKKLPFELDSTFKNYYRLVTKDLLDREMVSQYDITITCRDEGSPTLTSNKTIQLKVSDVNDSPPRFSQTSFTTYVTENNVIGSSIYSVPAFDSDLNQNSRLSYSILQTQVGDDPVSNYVSINSDSGVISAERSFDYEELKKFQIQVQAIDAGVPPLSSNVAVFVVILDQNDNAPVIISPIPEYGSTAVETVSRSAEPGYLVTKVSATDADSGPNARLSYLLAQATDPGLFTIAPDTGEIWTVRRITGQDAIRQRLVVLVKDDGLPPLTATINIILSLADSDDETLSEVSSLTEDARLPSDLSLYLVIALGTISSIFLVILVILAVKVHRSRNVFHRHSCSLDTGCCLGSTHSLNGIQKASVNLQIPPNYVEVFGRDPLSQNFCYEVKQPNADWRFSQTHRAELNSSQYREEEGVQRDIQREVQREVQCDVQCEAPRDVQCNVPHNIQHEVQRDVPCEVQRVVENEPSGARKPACARPVAIPAGRDGWTLPRTAPRMQLQMTLGPHVPGTLRSQYLIPRELHTSGARISNSSVEFIAPIVGSLHGPWAANQTRDHRGISSSSGRRPELDTQACGQIPGSPSGQRLSTQCLHSRDDHHSLREVNY